jgi:type I restriction enzyme S subunit
MNIKELPKYWEIKKMPEVVKWSSGGTPKATEKQYYENGTIPWLIIGDLNDGIVTESASRITQLGLENSSAKMIPSGTLLVAMYGSIGKLGITGIECCTNQAIAYAKELHGVITKYMYYYMAMMKPKLISMGKGGTQKNISQSVLNSLDVIVPPIPEQERIVARIEELFSQLDSGVETLKKTKEQLAVYRQAVLKEAFEGITEFASIRSVSTLVTSGSRGWAQYYSNTGAKFIRIGNLTRDSIDIDLNDIQYVDLPNKAEGLRTRLEKDDVLISITADLGSIGLVLENIGEAYINQHIALVRFKNPSQGKFMAWYLRSEKGQKDLLKNKRGGGKLGLGLDDIRDSRVPVVSNDEAERIVNGIESRLSVCESIEKTVDLALQQAEAMRQSILKKAFEGKI